MPWPSPPTASSRQSANGHIDNGWQLPSSGTNFEAYSSIGVLADRNYVHSRIYEVILAAYGILETTAPDRFFIYGETGYEKGGKFKPHKTHTNGLSVDFFVPVLDEQNRPAKLPISIFNKLGYNIEFDQNAHFKNLRIDFESIAKHLLALKKAADDRHVGITVVIFDNDFQKKLFQTNSGKNLSLILHFSTKKPWVRHDEHYHVDFDLPCKK